MKKKRLFLLLAISILTIGYAAVTATLNIDGGAVVGTNQDDFDVYFSNAKENGVTNKKIIIDDTHISFTTEMKSIEDTYTLEYDVTNGSKSYDAKLEINCTASDEYLSITNNFDTDNNLLATETRTGKLTVELIKSYARTFEDNKSIEKEISCEITGNAIERNSKAEGTPAEKRIRWKLTSDEDSDCRLSIGDIVTFGKESFYIYNIDGNNLKMIAQYNLLVGSTNDGTNRIPLENPTGLQSFDALGVTPDTSFPFIGTVAFDSTEPYSNIYETSTIKTEYIDPYGVKLKELNSGNEIEVGLITKEELEVLGCDSSNRTCKDSPFPWTWSTSYWTSSIDDTGRVWNVFSIGLFGTNGVNFDDRRGVRPVITISKSLFE